MGGRNLKRLRTILDASGCGEVQYERDARDSVRLFWNVSSSSWRSADAAFPFSHALTFVHDTDESQVFVCRLGCGWAGKGALRLCQSKCPSDAGDVKWTLTWRDAGEVHPALRPRNAAGCSHGVVAPSSSSRRPADPCLCYSQGILEALERGAEQMDKSDAVWCRTAWT